MANLRSLPLCVLSVALLFSTALAAQNAAPAVRVVNPIDESQRVTLKGTVHPLANALNDRGAAPDSLQLDRMHLVLKRSASQEAALQQFISEMHTPGSANYHKWLTPAQFGAQFGPSDQDLATVQTWLTGHGFNVTKVNPGGQSIEISGNVAQLRSAFHTQIHKYVVNGESHFANANDPQIPAALAPVVSGFVSLNNFRLKSYAKTLGKAGYDPKTDKAAPQWTTGGGTVASDNFVVAPGDFAVQYDLNPLYAQGINGNGQTIAIINESNINIDLVNQFRSLFGLSPNPPQVIVDGNDPGVDGINNPDGPNFASVEAYLDVEWSGAVAPSANIDLVIAADTALESGLVLAAERAVYSNIAPVISISFGSCESALGSSNPFLSSLWEQAAAQGITVLVSSGDAGSAGCDNDNSESFATLGQAVNGFASTPYNVAVGGTDFYYSDYATGGASAANYWNTSASNTTPAVSIKGVIPEQPWNDSQFGLNAYSVYAGSGDTATSIAGGGGGPSNAAVCPANNYNTSTGACNVAATGYPKPSWQVATGVPADGVRDLPDVSLFAANGYNGSYYAICATDGDCQPVSSGGTVQIVGVGGTSASTPAFAGIMALVNQRYGPQGQADTVLYPLYAQFPASFRDVIVGNNSEPCEVLPSVTPNCIAVTGPIVLSGVTEGQIGTGTTPEYKAAAGYDLASGLGTIDANQLVSNWGKVKLATTTTTMTPSKTSFAHGTSVNISGTVTSSSGTPTGDVALMADSTEPSQQGQTFFTLSNGSYTGSTSTLPGGTYNIWAAYGGDYTDGFSASPKTQITVTPEASAIDFNIFSGNSYFTSSSGPGTSVDYGTQLLLSALVAPSSQAAAYQTCLINGTTCPTFTSPTGTVTFSDSGTAITTVIDTALLNAEGDAEYNAPFSVGAHSVTAAYYGDKSYNAAPATSPITFTVIKDTPQIQLSATYIATTNTGGQEGVNGPGQPLVITVAVLNGAQLGAATSSAVYPVPVLPPTGTITVTSSPSLTGLSGTQTLSAAVDPPGQGGTAAVQGVANFTVPAGTANGTYNVTVCYSGDNNYFGYSGSNCPGYTIPIVNPNGNGSQNSTTNATISGTTSTPNAAITITGTVSGVSGHPAPSGGVYVYSSGYYVTSAGFSGSSGTTSNFVIVLNSQTMSPGANLITIQYPGDSVYNPSAVTLNSGNPFSNPLSDFSLIPNTTIVPVTAGSNGTDTLNLASVNGFTGTVNLTCAATSPVTCQVAPNPTLTSNGSATSTLTVTAPSGTVTGNYNVLVTGKDAATGQFIHTAGLTAAVSGTTNGTPGFTIANSGNITIAAGATTGNTSSISITPTSGFTGPVDLSCTVTPPAGTIVSPATCSIPASLQVTGVGAVSVNLTVSTTSTTTGGTYSVKVTGTAGSISQSTTVSVAVSVPSFTLGNSGGISLVQGVNSNNTSTITTTPTNSFTGTVSLTCAVTTVPTGASNPITCAAANLNPTSVSLTSASAQNSTLTITTTGTTTTGTYAVTVTGTSGSIVQTTQVSVTVSAAANTFSLSNSGNITVSPGATSGNTSTITVTPGASGFTGTVNLTCSITPTAASDPATCSFTSPSVSLTGTTAQTSTLTISTTAATALNEPLKLFWPSTGGAVLALVFLFGIPKRRRNWLAMLGLLVMFVSGVAIGCGGGGGSGGGGSNPSNPGTSAGTYTVTVTGTSGALAPTTTVTLTVN
jgi:subtilase family serine protease